MLPHHNRLIKKQDFDVLFREGKGISSGSISIRFRQNGTDQTRIGIIIGLKYSKKAVERNRIKRQLREIMRKKLGRIRGGWDMAVLARRSEGGKIQSKMLEQAVETALGKGGLIN